MPMNWPDSHWIWAPDVMQNEADGKYYYLYCQPCKLHLGVGDTPRGPWKNVLGESEAVLVPDRFVKNAITLGILFKDHPGELYAVRKDSPLIVGRTDGGNIIASDVPAVLKYTRDVGQVLLSLLPALQAPSGCGRYTSWSLEERAGRERSRARTG